MQHVFHLAELPQLSVSDDRFDVRYLHTENMTAAFNILKAGAEVPEHRHLHETVDYVQEGELEMVINGELHRMTAGTVCRIPSNVPHAARALTDCRVINLFYPVREDFAPAT